MFCSVCQSKPRVSPPTFSSADITTSPSLQNERKVWKNSVRFAFHTTSQLEK